MTLILEKFKPLHNHLIFIATGDRESFATYAIDHLSEHFDMAIFYYGRDTNKQAFLQQHSAIFAHGQGTKFNAFRSLALQQPEILNSYNTVWLCDDDAVPLSGELTVLPELLERFNLKVISPAYCPDGKVDHPIMRQRQSQALFRYVNFLEMGWPLFSAEALREFLEEYDGSLDGTGIPEWYGKFFQAEEKLVFGIADSVVFRNPFEAEKDGGAREIRQYISEAEELAQRDKVLLQHDIAAYKHRNVCFVYETDDGRVVMDEVTNGTSQSRLNPWVMLATLGVVFLYLLLM